jgi:acyl carrier protein
MTTALDIKALILSLLEPTLRANGLTAPSVSDDLDLRTEGLIDSLGFVQLLGQLEQRLGTPVDLSELDPAQLTNVGILSRHIADTRAK